ncbi:MAG: hypothetical protein JNK05_04385 [Myxococcales bacterium]|nr:hypothetical protein [Myxococcales bacterium]
MLIGTIRSDAFTLSVVLEDGRTLPVEFSVIDNAGQRVGDRVTLREDEVEQVIPLRSTSEALPLLRDAGILDGGVEVEATDAPWTHTLFERLWQSSMPRPRRASKMTGADRLRKDR